jgi:hypothetical protein
MPQASIAARQWQPPPGSVWQSQAAHNARLAATLSLHQLGADDSTQLVDMCATAQLDRMQQGPSPALTDESTEAFFAHAGPVSSDPYTAAADNAASVGTVGSSSQHDMCATAQLDRMQQGPSPALTDESTEAFFAHAGPVSSGPYTAAADNAASVGTVGSSSQHVCGSANPNSSSLAGSIDGERPVPTHPQPAAGDSIVTAARPLLQPSATRNCGPGAYNAISLGTADMEWLLDAEAAYSDGSVSTTDIDSWLRGAQAAAGARAAQKASTSPLSSSAALSHPSQPSAAALAGCPGTSVRRSHNSRPDRAVSHSTSQHGVTGSPLLQSSAAATAYAARVDTAMGSSSGGQLTARSASCGARSSVAGAASAAAQQAAPALPQLSSATAAKPPACSSREAGKPSADPTAQTRDGIQQQQQPPAAAPQQTEQQEEEDEIGGVYTVHKMPYTVLEVLGRGTSAIVYKVRMRSEDMEYA